MSSNRTYSIDNVTGSWKCGGITTWNTLQKVEKQKELVRSADSSKFSEDSIYCILHDALSLLHTQELLNNMSDTHTLVTRILPFQEECVFLKLQQCRSQTDVNISERIIENVLSSFGLKELMYP